MKFLKMKYHSKNSLKINDFFKKQLAKQKIELENMKHSNIELRKEKMNLIQENDKLKNKLVRLKEKQKRDSIKNLDSNENEESSNIDSEKLDEVIFKFYLKPFKIMILLLQRFFIISMVF